MKPTKHKTRPATRKMGKLWDRLIELGFVDFTLWWEPIGPALEMCGNSGWYMFQDKNGKLEPFGITVEWALKHADVYAAYVKAFPR